MRKRILALSVLLLMAFCFSAFLFNHTALASEAGTGTNSDTGTGTGTDSGIGTDTGTGSDTGNGTQVVTPAPTPYYLLIDRYPTKTTIYKGEKLDFSDMIVRGFYSDGTVGNITDYELIGYNPEQLGTQTVTVSYMGLAAGSINITVLPAKVTGIKVTSHSMTSLTLTWDSTGTNTLYEVYSLDDLTRNYILINSTYDNSITLEYLPGTVHSFQIRAVDNLYGVVYQGQFSDTFTAATAPDTVTGLTLTDTTVSTVSLSWNAVSGATGYLIYRAPSSSANYKKCGESSIPAYTDKKLSSGTSYSYKVYAYALNEQYYGANSNIVHTSTAPAKMVLNYKVGEEKVRFTWSKVTGATSYHIYIGDGDNFTLLTSKKAGSYSYTAEGLTTGETYTFYAEAERDLNGVVYSGQASDPITVEMTEIEPTSTTGKVFPAKANFLKSMSYLYISFFKKNVKYSKSFVIPGLISTNVGGFTSTSMCPQGITFAGNYLLQTAYDKTDEENSVMYVMDKTTGELLTTMILPNKTHAGGICFDGSNVWIPNGMHVSSVSISEIDKAVQEGVPYADIEYNSTCYLDLKASYLAYYNDKLWIGTYNELEDTQMISYTVEDKETSPSLTEEDIVAMPTRVQGVVFTEDGTLIISRSCQLYQGLRGYMRQLDVYKPDLENDVDGIYQLGELINCVEMPSMNEGIDISGSYLYVTYESGAFSNASFQMDRICAFKLSSIIKKKA